MKGTQTRVWLRAGELFDQLIELTPDERGAFLESQTDNDSAVLDVVQRLIAAHDLAIDAQPAKQAVASAFANFSSGLGELSPGTEIGPFKVERQLGAGGMGYVYLAQREIDGALQRVAIKIPSVGSTAESMRRFHQERAMLASLQHPAIAGLVDAGELSAGRPYLAMEYVDGEPLVEYCDRRRLTVAERVELAIRILAGLQYAHERLIVHRDIKSDNVFVDAQGQPRILDFGIGKLLDSARPGTADGQHYFTLACAAPEQIRGEPSSAATDVYAVAVLLYELLVGSPPLDFAGLTVPQALDRALQSVPPLASQRLRRDAGALPALANERRTTPGALERKLAGDLERVLARALRKNPQERYATAAAFADDLTAVLQQRPIAERRSERWYRARRFLARHRLAVGLTAAIALTLLVSVVILTQLAIDLRIARDRAESERVEAEQIAQFLQGLFRQADPLVMRGNQLSAKDLVDRGVADLAGALRDQPARRASLLLLLGRIQLIMSDLPAARALGEDALASGHETERARELLARAAFAAGDFRQAIEHADALSGGYEVGAAVPDLPLFGLSIKTRAQIALGELAGAQAVHALTNLVAEYSRRYGIDHPDTQHLRMRLAMSEVAAGDKESGREIIKEVTSNLSFGGDNNDPEMATWALRRAQIERESGRFDEARKLVQWALRVRTAVYGQQHPRTAAAIGALAIIEQRAGRFDEARQYYETCVAIAAASLPPDSAELVSYRYNLGSFLLTEVNDAAAAIPVLKSAYEAGMRTAAQGINTALYASRLGEAYAAVGDHQSARPAFETALRISARFGDRYRISMTKLTAEIACGRSTRSQADRIAIKRGIEMLEASYPDDHSLPRLRRCLDASPGVS